MKTLIFYSKRLTCNYQTEIEDNPEWCTSRSLDLFRKYLAGDKYYSHIVSFMADCSVVDSIDKLPKHSKNKDVIHF